MIKLTKMQVDALNELSSITAGNATTALSKVLSKDVRIDIPKARFYKAKDMSKGMGISVYFNVHGDISGQAVFHFQRKHAMKLIDHIMGRKKGTTKVLDKMAESAFGEMSNIFIGSYLNSLSNMLDLKIFQGVPVIASDYVESIIEYLYSRIDNPIKNILCFETRVIVEKKRIHGDFMFMFDQKSFRLLLSRLENKFGV